MKNLSTQIVIVLNMIIALYPFSCASYMVEVDSDSDYADKKHALAMLNQTQEGFKKDHSYLYSVACWKSALENMGHDFALQSAKEQIAKSCPNLNSPISKSQELVGRSGIYTCVLLVTPIQDSDCK